MLVNTMEVIHQESITTLAVVVAATTQAVGQEEALEAEQEVALGAVEQEEALEAEQEVALGAVEQEEALGGPAVEAELLEAQAQVVVVRAQAGLRLPAEIHWYST